MGMGRPHTLNTPERVKQVAELFVDGCTRQQIADIMGVSDLDTVTRWRRDARVKAVANKLIEDRVLQVTRKVDGVISARLEDAENLTVKELLDIRKEFLGGAFRQAVEGADTDTISEAMEALEGDPDFLTKLEKVFAKATDDNG